MNPQGKKEIREAVIIAGLCTLVNGLITWGIEASKAKVAEQKAKRKKAEDAEQKPQ